MYEVYLAADRKVMSRASVPVLWDKQQNTIVSDESSEIIRMFNIASDALTGNTADYYPANMHSEIESTMMAFTTM